MSDGEVLAIMLVAAIRTLAEDVAMVRAQLELIRWTVLAYVLWRIALEVLDRWPERWFRRWRRRR